MAAPTPIVFAPDERAYFPELVRTQAGYAALPVMGRRRRVWLDLNTGRSRARPPVVVETRTFDRDFMPAGIYRCASEAGRATQITRVEIDRVHGRPA